MPVRALLWRRDYSSSCLKHPIVTIAKVTSLLETTKPTANKAVTALVEVGVLVETTGRKRDRTFSYNAYLDLLRTGTELEERRG